MTTNEQPKLWNAILKCAECGKVLNMALNVPEEEKPRVSASSGLAAPRCTRGCRSTASDLNLNTTLEWIPVNGMRPEFEAIVSGWTLIDGMEDITQRIEQVGNWMELNGPLLAREEATLKLMVRTQIARGIGRGDFDGLGLSRNDLLSSLK